MKTKQRYKRRYKYYKEMNKHHQELFETAVGELKFQRLQTDHYKQLIYEVETLNEKNCDHKMINAVIKNGIERGNIDISIHFNLLNK